MKRGIEEDKERKEEGKIKKRRIESLERSQFNCLPDEIFDEILKLVPTRSFVGDASISGVCHFWNSRIKERRIVKTPEAILASCNSRDEALSILRDDGLCRHLTLDELLAVVSWVPEVVQHLFKNRHGLDADRLAILVRKDLSLAQSLIQEVARYQKYDTNTMISILAQYNLQIAKKILPEFLDKYRTEEHPYLSLPAYRIDSQNLYRIAQHPELVEYILTTPGIRDLLQGSELTKLGIQYGISLRILDTPKFAARLEPDDLGALGQHQVEIAHHILNKGLADKVATYYLYSWAVDYPEIADRIFENPLLRDEMGDVTKEEIETDRLKKAKQVIQNSSKRIPVTSGYDQLGKEIYPIVKQQVAMIPKEHAQEFKSLRFG